MWPFKPRHEHVWEKSGEPYFIQPRGFKSGWIAPDPAMVDECLYGVTVFNWRCKTCGRHDITKRPGRHLKTPLATRERQADDS